MQVPPQPPQSSPPPGYGQPPRASGVPVWVWVVVAVVGVCFVLPVMLGVFGLLSFGKAINNAVAEANKNAKTATVSSSALPAGWKHITASNITLDIPAGWTAVDPNDQKFIDAVNKADTSDAQAAQMKQIMQLAMSNKSYKLFVFHFPADKETAFAPNINVVATPAPAGATLKDLADGAEAQAKKMGNGLTQRESVQLGSGDAEVIRWQMPSTTTAGKVTLALRTYMVVQNGTGYVITVTFPTKLESSLGAESESIVRTFNVK